METLVIFVAWLLNNQLVNVTETFTDVLKYYFLQRMLLNLPSVCCKEVS